MAISRTWNIRLNLDEFNAMASSLFTDADRALALQGMTLGLNAGPCPASVPDAFRRGWEVGAKAREATEDIRRKNAEIGARGGRPAKSNGLPNGLPDGLPNGEPNGLPNGEPKPLTNNQEREARNEDPTPLTPQGGKRASARFSVDMWDHMIPLTFQVPLFLEAWHEWVQDRRDRKSAITEIGARNQLAKLLAEAKSPDVATSWIRGSIANGWKGIFEPRGSSRPQAADRGTGSPSYRSASDRALVEQLERRNAAKAPQSAQAGVQNDDDWSRFDEEIQNPCNPSAT